MGSCVYICTSSAARNAMDAYENGFEFCCLVGKHCDSFDGNIATYKIHHNTKHNILLF